MTNDRLRARINAAGLTVDRLAQLLEVDPKTVERWITRDRLPHHRNRLQVAEILNSDEGYLWPQILDDPRTQSASQAEFVHLYSHRGAIPQDMWGQLIDAAVDSIDVLVYSGLFLIDNQDDLVHRLTTKGAAGTKIRVLLGDPNSDAVLHRGQEEGLGDNMAARVRVSLDALRPAIAAPGVEIRTHSTVLYNSLYRFDDQQLVNTHVYGSSAAHNPVMHLRRVPGGRLFDHYMNAFDRIWASSTPVAGSPTSLTTA